MELKATRYDVGDGIAVVTLARPKRRNAWTGRMHTEYRWILREAEADPAVRVIVLTGDPEGQAFCAGADLQALEGHSERGGYDAGTPEDIAGAGPGTTLRASTRRSPITSGSASRSSRRSTGRRRAWAWCWRLRTRSGSARRARSSPPRTAGSTSRRSTAWLLPPRIIGLTHANDILLSSRKFTAEEAMAMGFPNASCRPSS